MTEVSQLLNRHRSIRSYKPDPIDPALVEQVCGDAITGGSSSGNLNSVTIVLTRDTERKRRLYELHFEQDFVLQAPLVVTFCADWFRTREWLKKRGARDNFNNFLGYHVAAFDAMIVAQNVCLGFEAHGIGICYMGTTLHSMGEIADYLELPDTCVPVTSPAGPARIRRSATGCRSPRSCTMKNTSGRATGSSKPSTSSAKCAAGHATWRTRS
jgi:nitroreductase